MATVKEIYGVMDRIAPFSYQMGFDNAGFLVGRENAPVTAVLVALDITPEVIGEAAAKNCELIVAHHPVIWEPMKRVTDTDTTGRRVLALLEHGIAAICAHTNLDAAEGGVNTALADALGLREQTVLEPMGADENGCAYGIGRIGTIGDAPLTLADFAVRVKAALNPDGVRAMDAGKPVRRVAVGGGSCGSMLEDAIAAGCDTFVTADVKHDVWLEARMRGLNLIDAGHYSTETVVCPVLAARLREAFPALRVEVSATQGEVFRYF